MTPSEFKAWFEGFTESMDGPPSLKQWERIQARVKQITGAPTSYPVFVDRYVPRTGPWWYQNGCNNVALLATNAAAAPSAGALDARCGSWDMNGGDGLQPTGRAVRLNDGGGTVLNAFDSHAAMNALGKADAADLKAA